jgi:diguanylate cyclase (GGDEF)-like protein
VVSGWVGSGFSLETLSTTTMSMPVLLGGALLSVGTLLTLRCDEAERRIGDLDAAVGRVVAAETLDDLTEAILEAAATVVHGRPLELYIWEPREQGFVPSGARNTIRALCAVPLFGGTLKDGAALAPTLGDWKYLDAELDRSFGDESRIPLSSGDGEVFGFLRLGGEEPSSADINHLLQILAHFSGLAIKNVLLFERLREQARRDGLTGLVNYAAFQDALTGAVQTASRSSKSLALVLMDLDKFKDVNDRHGHAAGSRMLQTLAEVWRSVLPPDAVLARCGGDEFACILPHTGPSGVLAHVKRLKEKLTETPISLASSQLTIASSIGVALFPGDASSADELFHAADLALYLAKRRGGEMVCMAGDEALAEIYGIAPGNDCPSPLALAARVETSAIDDGNALATVAHERGNCAIAPADLPVSQAPRLAAV